MSKPQQENIHKVTKKQWKKWPDLAQRVFNDTFSSLVNNQSLMTHPKTEWLPEKQWKTIAWNSAWMAASAATIAEKATS
ncbi:hypothetical protein LP414_27710 [Polaromonas sp. P1(28)-13]|nr:hypothetical protein LP414_27710 [Polaromonas sp. P1(28)-13]